VARSGILVGYARCSTQRQDLTAQREILLELGVAEAGSISITA
jgi:DNA invertase Pin-like site-specific DNA recombinase